MSPTHLLVFLLLLLASFGQVPELLYRLNKVLDFALNHYEEINFDGLLGFVIAEAQVRQSIQFGNNDETIQINFLLEKCKMVRKNVLPKLPRTPAKMIVLEHFLLHPEKWMLDKKFTNNSLEDLGINSKWTAEDIVADKLAWYKGVPSDHCLMEILAKNCYISSFCQEMMLATRIDKGYLLSHRLFYLQILRLKKCSFDENTFRNYTNRLCSLMLRETRTSEYWNFPAHDIALEQMVLCGIEGYAQFLNGNWKKRVMSWQTSFGCYRDREETNFKRSSNVIAFGCSDHTTGLGAAALALNLKYNMWIHNS